MWWIIVGVVVCAVGYGALGIWADNDYNYEMYTRWLRRYKR